MFKASLGTTVKITTIVCVLLLSIPSVILMLTFILNLFENKFDKKDVIMPILAIGLFAFLYWVFTERIIGYKILSEGIKIIKGTNSELIKKETILEVKPIAYKDLRFSIRTFGIGGVFGFSGSYTNKKFGDMTWYFTRKDKLVMIVTNTQKFILSPDKSEDFLKEVQKMIDEKPA